MKTMMILLLAMAALMPRPLAAQTDANALETAIHGKPFGLLGYPADPVLKYTWFDGKLIPGPVQLRGMEAFFADTVVQKGNKIIIDGQVETLVRDGAKIAPMGKMPMRLEIDMQGTVAAQVLPHLVAALFFPSLKAALDGLPDSVSDMLPFSSDGKFHSICHCGHIFQNGKWVRIEENDPKLAPPSFVKMASNPALGQKAIDEKVSGTISLIYYISDTGSVDDVWLAKPLAQDLDESAAKTARENSFRPAKYDGKPVGSVLMQTISVN